MLPEMNGGPQMELQSPGILNKFMEYLSDNCKRDELNGCLVHKTCGHVVVIDWFELSAKCTGCDEL